MKRDELIVSEWVSAENQIFESWISWGVGDVVALSAMTMAFFSLRPAVLCHYDMFVFAWACVCVRMCFIWAQEHETCLWRPPVWQLSALKLHTAHRSDWFYEPPSLCPASGGPLGCPTSCVHVCVCMCVFLNLKQSLAIKDLPFFIANCPCLLIYATEKEISNLQLFICLFLFRFSLFLSIQLFFLFSLTAVFL